LRKAWLLSAAVCAALFGVWALARAPARHPAGTPNTDAAPVVAADPEQSRAALAPLPTTATVLAATAPDPAATSENQFLRAVWNTSASDKSRALALALAGDARYSQTGTLAEARKALIITLLVDLGRMDEARAKVRQFIGNYPNSEYRPLVQGVTGIHPRPWGPNGELR